MYLPIAYLGIIAYCLLRKVLLSVLLPFRLYPPLPPPSIVFFPPPPRASPTSKIYLPGLIGALVRFRFLVLCYLCLLQFIRNCGESQADWSNGMNEPQDSIHHDMLTAP